MPNRTGMSEAQILQVLTGAFMIIGMQLQTHGLFTLPVNVEYAGYCAQIVLAAHTFIQRKKQKKGGGADA